MNRKIKDYFRQLRRGAAKLWLSLNSQLVVVGVTGSYGKTNSTNAIAQVLSSKLSVQKSDLNMDTIYNLPVTILKTKPWNEVLVLEYGVDHVSEMDLHLSLVKPKIAVFTGITPVHADKDHLGSLANIIKEKTKLVEAIDDGGVAIFNYDDENTRKVGEKFTKGKIFYGLNKKADVWADKISLTAERTTFILHDKDRKISIQTGLLGTPAVYSCLVAYIVAKYLGVEEKKITQKLKELKPLPGRFSFAPGPQGTFVINDALRANPASTLAGLTSFSHFPGRKIAILGEMGELGEHEEKMHRLIGEKAAGLKIDFIVGVGPLARLILEEAKKNGFNAGNLFWAKDVVQAAEILKPMIKKGDLLYLKASLLRHLERILLLLEGKEVACTKVSCLHYQPCSSCSKLLKCEYN